MISVTMFGNVGSDPEMRTTTGGTNILGFSVASNDGRGDQKTTTWVRVSVFGRQAETLRTLVAKGNRVLVVGSARQREWTKRDGSKAVDLEVDATDVRIIDYPEQEQQQAPPQQQRQAAPPPQAQRQVSPDGRYELDPSTNSWVPRAAPPPPPATNGAPPPPPAQASARVPF